MQLGIAAVYMVPEDGAPLLDLHLSQIEQHTEVPYTIYAGVNRLLPQFRDILAARPDVKICECEPTELRHAYENSHYSTQLVRAALEDGATHVAILHLDSFPVRPGWATSLARKLEEGYTLAGILLTENDDKLCPCSAFIFCPRKFYTTYGPIKSLAEQPKDDPDFKRYRRLRDEIEESGDAYGYLLYAHELPWYKLLRSNTANDHYIIAGVYDDTIFHLGGAVRPDKRFRGDSWHPDRSAHRKLLHRIASTMLSARIRKAIPESIHRLWDPQSASIEDINRRDFERIAAKLLADPQGFIHYLRTGNDTAESVMQ